MYSFHDELPINFNSNLPNDELGVETKKLDLYFSFNNT